MKLVVDFFVWKELSRYTTDGTLATGSFSSVIDCSIFCIDSWISYHLDSIFSAICLMLSATFDSGSPMTCVTSNSELGYGTCC